jgi:hypothetical protein
VPPAQFRFGGIFGFDIAEFIGNTCLVQKRLGLLAGGTFRVTKKQHGKSSLFFVDSIPYFRQFAHKNAKICE